MSRQESGVSKIDSLHSETSKNICFVFSLDFICLPKKVLPSVTPASRSDRRPAGWVTGGVTLRDGSVTLRDRGVTLTGRVPDGGSAGRISSCPIDVRHKLRRFTGVRGLGADFPILGSYSNLSVCGSKL